MHVAGVKLTCKAMTNVGLSLELANQDGHMVDREDKLRRPIWIR